MASAQYGLSKYSLIRLFAPPCSKNQLFACPGVWGSALMVEGRPRDWVSFSDAFSGLWCGVSVVLGSVTGADTRIEGVRHLLTGACWLGACTASVDPENGA